MKLGFILGLAPTKEHYGWGHTMFSYLHLSPSSNINPEDLVLSHATQNIHTTLQGMCILSTSHLLKSHSWGCKAVSSLAAWPMDPVLTTSVVNTMSTNVWGVCGASRARLGVTERTTLLSACKKKIQEERDSLMPQKKHQDIVPSAGHTGSTTEANK